MEGMTISEMLGQSGLLTLLGMCVVFSFIIILILCMSLLKFFVRAAKLDKNDASESTSNVAPAASAAVGNDGAVAAAIAAAIRTRENI